MIKISSYLFLSIIRIDYDVDLLLKYQEKIRKELGDRNYEIFIIPLSLN